MTGTCLRALPVWLFARTVCLALGATLFGTGGCAQKFVYTSHPAMDTRETGVFKIQLRPDKESLNSFVVFQLTVVNKTADPIEIDWNKTKYLYDGQPSGGFLFEGVEPGYVKGATVMVHRIPGHSVYHKIIAPTNRVAYAPIKYQQQLRTGEEPLSPGPLPPGVNGMELFLRHQHTETSVVLMVDIKETPAS